MNRLVAIVALLLLIAAAPARAGQEASAQQLPEQAQQRLDQIKQRLALTPEQIEQVRPIVAEEMQKFKALREKYTQGGDSSRRDRRKMAREVKDIRNDADKRLEKVLSKEQMKELNEMRDEWRQQMRDRAGRD